MSTQVLEREVVSMEKIETPFAPAPGPHQARMENLVREMWRGLEIEPPSAARPLVPVARVLDECALNAHEVPRLTRRLALDFLAERGVAIEESCAPRRSEGTEAIAWDEPLAGFLFANAGGGAVFVRSDDPIARRRFSAAHELGHFVLHFVPEATRLFARCQSIQFTAAEPLAGLMPVSSPVATLARTSAPSAAQAAQLAAQRAEEAAHRAREEEADAFAAELLMPWRLVSELAANERARWGDGDLLWRLSQQFLVSRKAMWRRLLQLGWLDIASPYDC